MKYVLVSGGVISGIGKGVIASSTGLLLKTTGLRVTSIKVDPYLNIDAGTMSPTEHGEVFVLDDGGEVDLDLGNYERYLNITLKRENNITTGKIYQKVLEGERRGDYLGRTVQVIPHITDAIQDWIQRVARVPVDDTNETPDVCIIELGGTVGDMENSHFVEALRQLRRRAGKNNFMQVHVSLVPIVNGEQKTKPTQQAVRDVRSAGLSPDLIACRCDFPLEKEAIEKIALFCQVEPNQVLAVHNVSPTYRVPLLLESQNLIPLLSEGLNLPPLTIPAKLLTQGKQILHAWKNLINAQDRLYEEVTIALVGKYKNHKESYLSVIKSLEHASMHCNRKLNLIYIDGAHLEPLSAETKSHTPADHHKAWHALCTASGVLIPGGFGARGTEGMIAAAKWARENHKPFLGICLGLQIAVIEYARNVCGIASASSIELFERCPDPVVVFMPEISKEHMGGTMRLGIRATHFQPDSAWSKLRRLYGDVEVIHERHRHRYEVNPSYIERLTKAGCHFIGKDDSGERMEVLELKGHPYFVAVQFHPEYLSRVLEPSVPYLGFIATAAGLLEDVSLKRGGMVNGHAATNGVNGIADGMDGIRI